MTLTETVTALQGALERTQSTEGLVLAEHLETLSNLELAEGEERERVYGGVITRGDRVGGVLY